MKKLILLSVVPLFSISQIDTIKYTDDTYFVGQHQNGEILSGKMYDENHQIVFEGEWRNNQPYSGNGKVCCWNSGKYFIGQYQNDKRVSGKMYDKNHQIVFEGEWRNNQPYSGNGKLFNNNNEVIFDGEFRDNFMWNGTFYKEPNMPIKISNGKRSDRNYYSKTDITSTSESTTITLKQDTITSHRWQDNTLTLTLGVGKIEHDWIFDTGAENFSVSSKDWNKIKKHLTYRPLNISYTSQGIGGKSRGSLVLVTSNIKIGDFKVKNVVLEISEDEYSLLGISFLEKFKNAQWDMKAKQITLYK